MPSSRFGPAAGRGCRDRSCSGRGSGKTDATRMQRIGADAADLLLAGGISRPRFLGAHRGIPGNEAFRSSAGAARHLVSSASFRASQESETERERMQRKRAESPDRSMNCHHHLDLPRQLFGWSSHQDRPPRSDLASRPPNKSKQRSQRLDCRGAIRQIGVFRPNPFSTLFRS